MKRPRFPWDWDRYTLGRYQLSEANGWTEYVVLVIITILLFCFHQVWIALALLAIVGGCYWYVQYGPTREATGSYLSDEFPDMFGPPDFDRTLRRPPTWIERQMTNGESRQIAKLLAILGVYTLLNLSRYHYSPYAWAIGSISVIAAILVRIPFL